MTGLPARLVYLNDYAKDLQGGGGEWAFHFEIGLMPQHQCCLHPFCIREWEIGEQGVPQDIQPMGKRHIMLYDLCNIFVKRPDVLYFGTAPHYMN